MTPDQIQDRYRWISKQYAKLESTVSLYNDYDLDRILGIQRPSLMHRIRMSFRYYLHRMLYGS